MRKRILFVLFATITMSCLRGQINVTFLLNEGFLIQSNDQTIMIDAIHGSPRTSNPTPDSLFNLMIDKEPPFKNIDVAIISHPHSDHVNSQKVIQFMKHHPETKLITVPGVAAVLQKRDSAIYEQVKSRILIQDIQIHQYSDIELEGIGFRFLGLNHSVPGRSPLLSLSSIIKFSNGAMVHLADQYPQSNIGFLKTPHLFPSKLNLLFTDLHCIRNEVGREIIDVIDADQLIGMHIGTRKVAQRLPELQAFYPEVFVFKRLMQQSIF